jgi:hypothetical protein
MIGDIVTFIGASSGGGGTRSLFSGGCWRSFWSFSAFSWFEVVISWFVEATIISAGSGVFAGGSMGITLAGGTLGTLFVAFSEDCSSTL